MKPIEPGCLCVVIYPDYWGWPVRVIDRPVEGGGFPDGTSYEFSARHRAWVVESLSASWKTIKNAEKYRVQSDKYACIPEWFLKRIDGHEPEKITRKTEQPVTA